MTTSEASPSVHLQCLKNCLSENLSGDGIVSPSDSSRSPTNNNNNNSIHNNNTTSTKSHPINLVPEVQGSYGTVDRETSSSQSVIKSTPTVASNITSDQSQVSYNNCRGTGSAGIDSSGPELASVQVSGERERDSSEGNRAALKITENHLSTKVLRNKSAPYPIPNSSSSSLLTNPKQNQDKSNHSQVNPSASVARSTNSTFIASTDDEVQVVFDNVPVNPGQVDERNLNSQQSSLQQSSELSFVQSGCVSNNGVPHPNNMVIKTEPNGNNIELTLDNQFHHAHPFQSQSNGSGATDCCATSLGCHLNEESVGSSMQPHDAFLGALNNQHPPHNNGLFPCSHNCGGMSLGPGNGSMGSVSGNSNGAGSMTSPGGSLDEHDCDDDKVINGDTFATGDLPDPDAIKMFVGQVPKHLNEPELRTLFEEYGRVFQINVLRDKVTKQSKGCCFVTFYTRKSALDAQNALHNVKTLPGMNHPIQMKPADNENRYERKLFVGMISRKCTEADVRNMFQRFGVIDDCTVLRLASGESRGCAFVTFASKQSAQNAIKAVHHSTTMEGCSAPIVVKFADTPKDKDQKRQQTIPSTTLMGGLSASAIAPLSQPQSMFSGLLKLEQILQHLQQPTLTQQGYSQLSPLSVGGLSGLGSLGSANGGALTALGSSISSTDLQLALALSSNPAANQQQFVSLATLAALGNHSSLSPADGRYGMGITHNADLNYPGASGTSLGTSNQLPVGSNGFQSGLTSFSGAIRSHVASKQTEGPDGANLFIYHLPPWLGDLELAQMFAPFGNVLSAKVFIEKSTNRSKCFGFVSYDSPVSAQLAIQQMNGYQIEMKRLKVQLKRPRESAKPY